MLPGSSRSFAWHEFLNRPPLSLDRARAAASLQGKSILITGAGGSIGAALAGAIAELAPRQLLLLEASECNLNDVEAALEQLPHSVECVSLLGSVADQALLEDVFGRFQPNIVFHAAAFKHVPLLEQNPFAAIQNNTLATHLLHRMAQKYGAEQFLLLSTDKAVEPVSILGASKRIAELILLAPDTCSLASKAVRLGNVLGSTGSIVPLFLEQIASGAPVTVTHTDVRRYFLTSADAVTLLLHAASLNTGRGILVPDLGLPLKVEALARFLLKRQASDPGSLSFTQLRPGDKMCEALVSVRESYSPPVDALLRSVASPAVTTDVLDHALFELAAACRQRSLGRLLAVITRLVPDYQPSALLTVKETV